MTNPPPFPWSEAMAFGFGVLRLSSDEFWRLTPRELAAAVRALRGESMPLSRDVLDELIARFPDRK
ncbi:MAG: rcc01693 family protein [Xanthobacteraceae bacterium]